MWWLAVALGLGVLLALVTLGNPLRIARLPFRSVWMLVLGFGGLIALEFVDLTRDRLDDVGLGLLMAAYALVLAFCFVNLRIAGVALVALGVVLNLIVIGLNQGMPTREIDERTVKERPEGDDDLADFLGQTIALPDNRLDEALAPGDVVIAAGIVWLLWSGSRRRIRHRAPRPALRPAPRAEAPTPEPLYPEPLHPEPPVAEPQPAPPRARTAAEEWAEWRAELERIAGNLGHDAAEREQ